MKSIAQVMVLALGLAAISGDARASEPPGTPSPDTMHRLAALRAVVALHAWLHWSEPKKIVSPDHVWELAVIPVYTGGGNHTPVVVRKRGGGRANDVLTLERNANIYWGSESKLLILDRGITNPPRILLFRLESTGDVTQLRRTAPDLDADVRGRLLRALGRTEAVAFYVPTFASWTGSRLVLRLGGTVYTKPASSMTPYCYRVTIDSRTAKMESMAQESAHDGSTKCQMFP